MAGGFATLTQTTDRYLAVRRAVGFRLRVTEGFLRSYARFAAERGEVHIHAQTAWTGLRWLPLPRGRRLEAVTIFAQHARAEDRQHEVPPRNAFTRQRLLYRPFIFTEDQIRQLLERAAQTAPSFSVTSSASYSRNLTGRMRNAVDSVDITSTV